MGSYKRIGGDFFLNLAASLILLFTTEFLVMPHLAARMSSDDYGQVLLLVGVITTFSSAFGNGLNNVRLIMHHKYVSQKLAGDYNLLLRYLSGGMVIVGIGTGFWGGFGMLDTIILTILSLLGGMRLYLSVAFRLYINYRGILWLNFILSLGYAIAIFVFDSMVERGSWWLVFLVGEMAALVYLLCATDLLQEPRRSTPLMGEVCKSFGWLGFLTFLGSLLNVMDRNLLLPALGGEAVAVLFVAMATGKTISYVAKPLGNVMLSYFAQVGFVMTRRKYWQINFGALAAGVVCYLVSIAAAGSVIHKFYPAYEMQALPLIQQASALPILMMMGALAQPAVMRYAKLSTLSFWQSMYVIVYIGIALLLIRMYGLYGFCYAAIILSMIRLFILWWLGAKSIND